MSIFFFLVAALFTFGSTGLAAVSGQDTFAQDASLSQVHDTSLSQALVVSVAKKKPPHPHCGGPEDEHNPRDNEHRGKPDIEHEPKNDHDPKQCHQHRQLCVF